MGRLKNHVKGLGEPGMRSLHAVGHRLATTHESITPETLANYVRALDRGELGWWNGPKGRRYVQPLLELSLIHI